MCRLLSPACGFRIIRGGPEPTHRTSRILTKPGCPLDPHRYPHTVRAKAKASTNFPPLCSDDWAGLCMIRGDGELCGSQTDAGGRGTWPRDVWEPRKPLVHVEEEKVDNSSARPQEHSPRHLWVAQGINSKLLLYGHAS